MVYIFKKSERAIEQLQQVVDFLKLVKHEIPLIIYTYYAIGGLDKELPALSRYKNYIMANMPLTLKSHFNSLIRFETKKKQNSRQND